MKFWLRIQQILLFTGGLDLIFMVAFVAMERTKHQWEKLLADAGLRLNKVWTNEVSDAIIEATLP